MKKLIEIVSNLSRVDAASLKGFRVEAFCDIKPCPCLVTVLQAGLS